LPNFETVYKGNGVIKTLIFDLGGVIVPFDFGRVYARLRDETGLRQEEVRERISRNDLPRRLECGAIEPRDFHAEVMDSLGARMDYAGFCDLWNSIFSPQTLIPESLLESLKNRHRLLLLSNTNAIHFEMLNAEYPLLRHFDRYILSYEVGAMKPEPRIYREAIQHAGCDPAECFFTDDIASYVEGARREGIDAVQFTGLDSLRAELRARGIN
jgi:putative hydrolase of the HAD superfamily